MDSTGPHECSLFWMYKLFYLWEKKHIFMIPFWMLSEMSEMYYTLQEAEEKEKEDKENNDKKM